MTSVLVVLAPGAEEIETVTVADVLVRAGAQVVVASTAEALVVSGSRGIPLAAHTLLDQVRHQTFDLVYLPGGGGSAACCRDDPRIQDLAEAQLRSGRLLGVICAAPISLVPRKLCAGRRVTSYPGVRAQVEPHAAAWIDQPVVVDGNLVTSQGPGTAMAFALTLAGLLKGSGVASQVARDMLYPEPAMRAEE
jgi:4-methyl-5(b-hydroxyethyl)-thiazole monophosphate biosynthesis